MKSLYEMKEAAKIVSLYADHIKHVILDHEDMVGFFGSMCLSQSNFICNCMLSSAKSLTVSACFYLLMFES